MQKVMDLNAVRQFLKVAECQSFTVAAGQLGLTQSGISRAISRLEQQLGVRLLHRNTRSLSLTPDGFAFRERCAPLLQELEEAGKLLQDQGCSPKGLFKISAPSAFGRRVLMPILAQLLEQHPELQIEVAMTDRVVDLVEEGFDAVIRTGKIEDQRLIARPLAPLCWVTVASPIYLERHGTPKTLADLAAHNCLTVRNPNNGRQIDWRFVEAGKPVNVSVKGNLQFDHGDPLLEAAMLGVGVVQFMAFYAKEALQNGKLVEVLPEFKGQYRPLSLVYQPSRQHSGKIQVLREALLEHWG